MSGPWSMDFGVFVGRGWEEVNGDLVVGKCGGG